jgi:hypothetical protein
MVVASRGELIGKPGHGVEGRQGWGVAAGSKTS